MSLEDLLAQDRAAAQICAEQSPPASPGGRVQTILKLKLHDVSGVPLEAVPGSRIHPQLGRYVVAHLLAQNARTLSKFQFESEIPVRFCLVADGGVRREAGESGGLEADAARKEGRSVSVSGKARIWQRGIWVFFSWIERLASGLLFMAYTPALCLGLRRRAMTNHANDFKRG
jgi:hypothetical protein